MKQLILFSIFLMNINILIADNSDSIVKIEAGPFVKPIIEHKYSSDVLDSLKTRIFSDTTRLKLDFKRRFLNNKYNLKERSYYTELKKGIKQIVEKNFEGYYLQIIPMIEIDTIIKKQYPNKTIEKYFRLDKPIDKYQCFIWLKDSLLYRYDMVDSIAIRCPTVPENSYIGRRILSHYHYFSKLPSKFVFYVNGFHHLWYFTDDTISLYSSREYKETKNFIDANYMINDYLTIRYFKDMWFFKRLND